MVELFEFGFIHGRFQIFHNEHLLYALTAKKNCRKLIVGITSPDTSTALYEETDPHRSDVAANPCTYYERLCMVKLALSSVGLSGTEFDIVPLPISNPKLIRNYIPKNAVSFFTIYDQWGYEKLRRIGELGYQTYVLWDDKPKAFSGSDIREAIYRSIEWKHYVPDVVYKYIQLNEIDKRVIELMKLWRKDL